MNDELIHYGTKRHSGRYPWGSGEHPYQRDNRDFLARYSELKKKGMSETEIAAQMECYKKKWNKEKHQWEDIPSTRVLRARHQVATNEVKKEDIYFVSELKDKGYSIKAITERTGIPDSTVRLYLKQANEPIVNETIQKADELMKCADEKLYLDVGKGVQYDLNCSEERLKNALTVCEEQGYNVYTVKIEQPGTGHYTQMRILCPPDVTYGQLMNNRDKIRTPENYIQDTDGITKLGMLPPVSVDSDRIKVRFAEEGGAEREGVIQLKRGVDDISLGKAQYAQVRIAVDDTHYMKGMAMYGDDKDFPPGVDIIFNTNKSQELGKLGVMKKLKEDPDNPFGATIKEEFKQNGEPGLKMCQRYYIDENGERKQSSINVVNEEGDWGEWKKTLASQMLSKQPVPLAKQQIDRAIEFKKSELEDIMSVNNPTVQKKLLYSFAESCDYDSVHLQAAALPRQSSKVILPFSDLKDNEIYAPSYKEGESVILIRYPHAGTFEIPELKVTNTRNTSAKKTLGNATDAVGINYKVAEKLSGADFDGDTVLVIPVKNTKGERIVNIKTSPQLEALKNWDFHEIYKIQDKDKTPVIKPKTKQIEMGKVTNLITDMTILGATTEDITKAVKHSMVIIDAEKHELDYKQSAKDNDIAALKQRYQGGHGAATLISKAKSPKRVDERGELVRINEDTGEKMYKETGRTIKKKNEETGMYYDTGVKATTKTTKMADVKDARELMSSKTGTPMERVYADYANKLKTMANDSRKKASSIKDITYSPTARKVYDAEVKSLNEKLLKALKNAPKERQALILANDKIKAMKLADPSLESDNDKLKKVKNQALSGARAKVGAKKEQIYITDNEWKAIQSGAVSKSKLEEIINNSDEKRLKQLSMPRNDKGLSTAQKNRIKALNNSGKTLSEIADAIGISTSSVSRVLNA